jgi:hypothetical protein
MSPEFGREGAGEMGPRIDDADFASQKMRKIFDIFGIKIRNGRRLSGNLIKIFRSILSM